MDAQSSNALPPEPAAVAELQLLVQRAQAGDATALPRLREMLDAHPEIWQSVGDIAALAERAWIAVLAAEHPLAVESIKRSLAELKAELAGDHPTGLERLVVEQIVSCWTEVKYLELLAAAQGSGSLEQAGFSLKRRESAHKRYLEAVKMLPTLRALLPKGVAPAESVRLHEPEKALA